MSDAELMALRDGVDCRAVLERAGWALDARESTARAAKYRHGTAEIVIVTHNGKGWFDPLNDGAKGDVIALAQRLWGGSIGHARKVLRPLAGVMPAFKPVERKRPARSRPELAAEWETKGSVKRGRPGWAYLHEVRGLPASTLERAAAARALREGIHGTVWAGHHDDQGLVCGWEMRGPTYRGFSRDGTKTLFRIGADRPVRLAVTESFIDALSLATLEAWDTATLYISTGGGFGPATVAQLTNLAAPQIRLISAMDRGQGGELLTARLAKVAEASGCGFARVRPAAKDWNAQLRGTED